MSDQYPELIEAQFETARLRRSPRYGVFLALGAVLGVVVALILTFAFHGTDEKSAATGVLYSDSQVFGFLVLAAIPIGMALGAAVALLLDRTIGRRSRDVAVEHDRILTTHDSD